MKRNIILSICCLILMSGCANTLDIVNFYFSGPPSWVKNPNSNLNNADAILYVAGPSKSIDEARSDAINNFANTIICDIKSMEETSEVVSSDEKTREISTYLKTNLKSSSSVTLKGFIEINRWKNPVTKEFYVQYKMLKQDFLESKKATEDKIKELINVDNKLKKSILTLEKMVEPSFIKHYYNSIDLYHALINREWDIPLYVEVDSHLVQAEIFLNQYIKRIFSSITIQLITSNLQCEDTDEKLLQFKINSNKYEDFSQIKFYLLNVDSKKEYATISNKDGTFSFTIPPSDLIIGKNNFICSLNGLDDSSLIDNLEIPYKNIELNVIHTPKTPSGLRLFLSNPPWGSVYLTWNSVDDASRYFIYRKEVSAYSNEYVKIASTFYNFYEDSNIEDNKRYLYRVTSVNNLSDTESDVSIVKTIRTDKKPVLELKLSKNTAVGCEEIIFYWNDIEGFRNIDSKFKLELIKDDMIYYSINNIPNLFRYT